METNGAESMAVLLPVSDTYAEHLPYFGMDIIKSLFDSLFLECVVLNQLLQLKALNSGKQQESQVLG